MVYATPLALRELIVDAYERGDGTYDEVGDTYGVGKATVERLVRQWRETHRLDVVYTRKNGPAAKVPDEDLPELKAFVLDGRSDLTAETLKDAWCAFKGVTLSRSSMVRALLKIDLSRKKRASSRRSKIGPTSPRNVFASVKPSSN